MFESRDLLRFLTTFVPLLVVTFLFALVAWHLWQVVMRLLQRRWIKRFDLVMPATVHPPGLGQAVDLGVEILSRRKLVVREIRLRLVCLETAITRGYPDRHTTGQGHLQERVWRDVPVEKRREEVLTSEFVIPRQSMHTFEGTNFFVEWMVEARLTLRRGMTRTISRPMVVKPELIGASA
ncbi:MAG: hypothetical protein ACOCXX_04850 [Planctomycetota bacterium]